MRAAAPEPHLDDATRRTVLAGFGALSGAAAAPAAMAQTAPGTPQSYFASILRAVATLARLGQPLPEEVVAALVEQARRGDTDSIQAAEAILAPFVLADVAFGADGLLRAQPGAADRVLVEQGWRLFLVRIRNSGGVRAPLFVSNGLMTPGQMRLTANAQRARLLDTVAPEELVRRLWLRSELAEDGPLSGAPIEYRVIQVFSRDRGDREGTIGFGTTTLPRDPASALDAVDAERGLTAAYRCLPSSEVAVSIRDADGHGCMASLTIRDRAGRICPPQPMRVAPDMAFHPQVYRADGESVRLAAGVYTVESWRGPEYLGQTQTISAGDGGVIAVALQRWIDPASWGWYSGDTHIHAAGCAHYENPTEGVTPETMIRHVRGEGLAIGEVLTWGPGYYYQRQFFTGHTTSPVASLEHPRLQAANNAQFRTQPTLRDAESLLRYDVEVSGFPSSHSGHLVLLRLTDQIYPGAADISDWPSWTLPILQWSKKQGAVVGFAHCWSGMFVRSGRLPNYEIPAFSGIGANEAIVDVTHGVVDFLSGCERTPVAELNAWYHLLNSGYRLSMAGETDYPCVFGDRPGVGRSYVRLPVRPTGDPGYDAWVAGLKAGRLYCGDGRSHILEFRIAGRANGEGDVRLSRPGHVEIDALVAARIEPTPTAETEGLRRLAPESPDATWHVERARIGATRNVRLEVVVNGEPTGESVLLADGHPHRVRFKVPIARSSWVALRILPSVHSHPIFIVVDDKPVRASRRSAQWCRACVDKLWQVKSPFIREGERAEAAEAYAHARRAYEAIEQECEVE